MQMQTQMQSMRWPMPLLLPTRLLFQLLGFYQGVVAMMDIRHFALPNPPRMPHFIDPGTAPPSFIFAPGQIQPPYDIHASDVPEPYPSCVADFASVCAVQHAIRLVSRAREEACPELVVGGTQRLAALANITSGAFEAEGTTGFGVFVVDPSGFIAADSLRPTLVGERFDGYRSIGLVPDSTLLEYLDWLVTWGGGFLPHLTTRLSSTEVDVMAGEAPEEATAYFESCPNGDRLGVAFKREPMQGFEECSSNTNDFCAEQNIRRIAGLILVDVLNTFSHPEMVKIYYEMSYGEVYDVATYYASAYQIGWWGYPGENEYSNPSPLENTYSTCMSAGNGMVEESAGRNLTDWYTGNVGEMDAGAYLQWKLGSVAWKGSGFMDYYWHTNVLGWHYKVTLGFGYVWNNTAHAVGTGMAHRPQTAAFGPNCENCTDQSLPCAMQNAYRLTAHASAEYRKMGSSWETISKSTWFGSMHEDADDGDGEYAGTWPWGTYAFAFDFEGECVAHGEDASYIGQDASVIFGSAETHERFKVAASMGGWLRYELPDGENRLARVVKHAKNGHFYYLASSFRVSRAEYPKPCSAQYYEPCGEEAAQALLGEAAADMLSAEDRDSLQVRIDAITSRLGNYSEEFYDDFQAYIFDAEWECASNTNCPFFPFHWITALSEVAATADGGWATLTEVSDAPASLGYTIALEWSSPLAVDAARYYLVVVLLDSPGPPTCEGTDDLGNCPENAECVSGRCACSYGFLDKFTEESDYCGPLPPSSLECLDVRHKLCTGLVCVDCTPGYYCPAGSLIQCYDGFVCSGSSAPQACPKGTIANSTGQFLTTLDDCQTCPAGSYNDAEGQTECFACEVGTAQNNTRSSTCIRCEIGYYEDSVGSRGCHQCPGVLTTGYSGATSFNDCICPPGTYQVKGSTSCAQCPEGMDCSEANSTEAAIPPIGVSSPWPYPKASPGYMVLESAPLDAYKCQDASWCPGGTAGSCAEGRDQEVVGCSKCLAGKFTTQNGPCDDCDSSAVFILIASACVGLLVGLAVFAHVVNRNQLNQSSAMLIVVITLGLTVSAVQTLGIFSNLSVTWTEPLRSMFKVLSLVSFDLKVLKIECLVGNQSVRNMVVRQLVAPAAACYIALVVTIKKHLLHKKKSTTIDLPSQIMNGIGAVFQVFFVAILLSALMPLICYKHPNNLGHSMVSDPSVLCNEEGEHLSLVMVSGGALVAVILPYMAVTLSATVRYRTLMGHSSASRHLQMFRFLFFRYYPHAYYYGFLTLMRGALVCLVPVVFRDAPPLQLLFMATILLGFCSMQLHVKPWRGSMPNFVDASSNLLMVLLIVAVAMTTDFDDADGMLGIFSGMIFVGLFLALFGLVLFNIFKYFRPSPFFANFVCHHKAQAAAQARYIQILLIQRTRTSCFLDSDNLTNLEELFDIVRSRCGRLICYLTSDTLRRPWCAGEITITYQTHKRLAAIFHPTFAFPTAEQMKAENMEMYLATADFKLVEYGLSDEVISQAFRWLLYDCPNKYMMPTDLVGRARFEECVVWLQRNKSQAVGLEPTPTSVFSNTLAAPTKFFSTPSGGPGKTTSCIPRPNCLVVSSLPGDDEALAAAGVLIGKLQEAVLDLVPAGILLLADVPPQSQKEVCDAIFSAHAMLVILTPGSFGSTEQLQHIMDTSLEDVPTIPINTPHFRFPGPEFFDNELPLRYGKQAPEIEAKLRNFLKNITVPFTTYGSQQVLDVQADSVVQRIPRQAGTAATSVNSKRSHRQLDLMLAEHSTTISRFSSGFSRTMTGVRSDSKDSAAVPRMFNGHAPGSNPFFSASGAFPPVIDALTDQCLEMTC